MSDIKDKNNTLDFNPLIFETTNYNHSEFLQKNGEKQLLQDDIKGLKLFELALELDKNNYKLFYRQGLALLKYGEKKNIKKYLLLANKKFKKSVKLVPEFFNGWKSWGDTLLILGNTLNQHHFFLESKEKFQTALKYIENTNNFDIANIYYMLGKILEIIANKSGETSDLSYAFEAYSKAVSYNENLSSKFWGDFGKASLKLGIQINDIRLYLKSINCHKNSVAKSPSDYENWYNLADVISHLYQITYDEDHFYQANECFTRSAKLKIDNKLIWRRWAELLTNSGKHLFDVKRVYAAVEKCQTASSYGCNDEKIMIIWSEALAAIGIISDKLDPIIEATNKIAKTKEEFGDTEDICRAHGIILYTLGQYYNEVDYYYQAVEKFQEGLSINRTNHQLWYHLGNTYATIADIESDISIYDRVSKFSLKAIELQGDSLYHYKYARVLTKIAEFNQENTTLENAISHFEQALMLQKNGINAHAELLFYYATALDLMGDFLDNDKYYIKAIEILKRVLTINNNFDEIHHKLGVVYSHLGELVSEPEIFQLAISHYKIAYTENEENEQLLLDWAISLINLSETSNDNEYKEQILKEAEYKLIQSYKLGNVDVYYHLSCIYSLTQQYEKAIYFLEKSEQFGSLPPYDIVLEDSWLENLRYTELFKSFMNLS